MEARHRLGDHTALGGKEIRLLGGRSAAARQRRAGCSTLLGERVWLLESWMASAARWGGKGLRVVVEGVWAVMAGVGAWGRGRLGGVD